ncbi:hypothetical protein ACRALDRAFT_2088304, partial [Sodiomyces alcalophilus JCM 7366]|uniref:uncharacterized protein n=1 Tax=Sodiomyces alcalophilus JCM 7366 TaxID=591952 RepID=UPI0039B4E683
LSPPNLLLLAVHLATNAAVGKLACLARQHHTILRKDIVFRILLAYLPETVPSSEYLPSIEALSSGAHVDCEPIDIELSIVQGLSVEAASRKIRQLRLLALCDPKSPAEVGNDSLASFLFRRAYRVDHNAGMLIQLPVLLSPFVSHNEEIHTWVVSTLLPLARRNFEYYPCHAAPYNLAEFQALSDLAAVNALLSQTGRVGDHSVVGRDLRGLVGPWLCSRARWLSVLDADESLRGAAGPTDDQICPGWEGVMEWLITNASKNWTVACAAIMQWNGASDINLGDFEFTWPQQKHQSYLDRRYARAIIASAYLVPEATADALEAVHQTLVKVTELQGKGNLPSLASAAESLSAILLLNQDDVQLNPTMYLRGYLLSESNPLTHPSPANISQLHALIVSAYLLTRAGLPTPVRRAADLAFSQDEREQRAEAAKLISVIANRNHWSDNSSWTRTRRELLWLRNWGVAPGADFPAMGVFGRLDGEYLEHEFLKALLVNSRYSLAKELYEDDPSPLSLNVLRDTVLGAALSAFDHATDPGPVREGVEKCEQIITAFRKTLPASLHKRQQFEYLLKAAHSLSRYRLVSKQDEPATPVFLRMHSDPISIIAKVLEQNPNGYTRIQDLLQMAYNMVKAGLPDNHWPNGSANGGSSPNIYPWVEERLASTERRVTAMCIDAALREEDFETAYSYTVNRLTRDASSRHGLEARYREDLAWRAALQAGQYTHSSRSIPPTHLGTASGDPDIRHLQQRLECFSASLCMAPASQLQNILKSFCKCEKELDSALVEEIPRGIDSGKENTRLHRLPESLGFTTAGAAEMMLSSSARPDASTINKQAEDIMPMSLFDLSRATARAASRNLSALSSLQQSSNAGHVSLDVETIAEYGKVGDYLDDQHRERIRKRDQLREAAMGTLATSVGWLIGA